MCFVLFFSRFRKGQCRPIKSAGQWIGRALCVTSRPLFSEPSSSNCMWVERMHLAVCLSVCMLPFLLGWFPGIPRFVVTFFPYEPFFYFLHAQPDKITLSPFPFPTYKGKALNSPRCACCRAADSGSLLRHTEPHSWILNQFCLPYVSRGHLHQNSQLNLTVFVVIFVQISP